MFSIPKALANRSIRRVDTPFISFDQHYLLGHPCEIADITVH
jgi:hypothetical protein